MKYGKILVSVFVIVFLAVFVYAWAYDSDGGFNIYQKGTCFDNSGNYTDACPILSAHPQDLREWYPVNGTNSTFCTSQVVNCADYNRTCLNGACVIVSNFTR